MNLHILLDSFPLGLASKSPKSADVLGFDQWSRGMLAAGNRIYIPEVIDYELRRELLRANKTNSIRGLDGLKTIFRYLPITTDAMLRAAELWAHSRRTGIPTGDPKKLDIDVILAAQALTLPVSSTGVIVATSNVAHLARFVPADHWNNITV
jgi:predicted nucleic acid-binding protein